MHSKHYESKKAKTTYILERKEYLTKVSVPLKEQIQYSTWAMSISLHVVSNVIIASLDYLDRELLITSDLTENYISSSDQPHVRIIN